VTEPAIAESLLLVLRERFGAEEIPGIDRVWLFPPRRIGQRESSVAVIAMMPADRPDRRRILTLHHLRPIPGGTTPAEDHMVEQGTAPADRVDTVVQGVLMRLRDAMETPREVEIAGDPDNWSGLVGGEPAG